MVMAAAILAAQAKALDHPQPEQDDRRSQADRFVGRDQSDYAGAESHAAQRDQERVLAPDLVAQPSEQKRSQWTDQESGGEKFDRDQQRRNRMALVEDFDSKHDDTDDY